jgi:HSP20 family protein
MATHQSQKSNQETPNTNKQSEAGTQNLAQSSNKTNDQSSQQRGMAKREPSHTSRYNSPFSFMRRFSEEMDRLFDDFGFGSGLLSPSFERGFSSSALGEFGQGLWSPQIETFEREGQLVIRADLPGLTKDDVNVEMTDNAITISGERRNENEEKREGYYRSERSYGSFYRQIPLPEGVNADDANATFRNGVLEITMKAPQLQSRSRKLEITEGGTEEQRSRAHTSGK